MSKIINRSLFLMLFVFVAYSQFTNSVFAESIENPVTPVIVANDDIYNQTPETYGYNFVTDQDNALNFSSTIFLQNDVYIDGDLKGLIPEDADVEILSQSDICPLQDYGSLSGHPTYLDRKPGFRFNCTIAGTYTFTYKIIYNGVESNVATVTILVKK